MGNKPAGYDWFKAMFESSAAAMFRCRADGRIVAANRAFERLLGYPAKTLLKKRLQDLTPPKYLPLCMRQLERLAAGAPSTEFLKAYRRKDGSLVHVRVTGFPVKDHAGRTTDYAAVVRDIQAFREKEESLRREVAATEAALRESLSLSEAALESTADGVLVIDRGGRIRFLNSRFLEIWSIPTRITNNREKVLAYVTDQVKAPESFLKRISQLYARPNEESFEVLELKDGRVFERYSRPQRVGEEIVGRVWSFRDVTLETRLEKEIAEISGREQARIGRDLHDTVGQTLTALSLLAGAAGKDGPAKRLRELTQIAIRQLRVLARGLLPPELAAGDLASALRELARDARELFGLSCTVAARGDARLADRGAAVELYRIAQEAARNAAKHARAKAVRITLEAGARKLRLTIVDDGVGLPAKTAGEGLGLAIMSHRARALGGTLVVGPAGKRGTRVVCECPRPR